MAEVLLLRLQPWRIPHQPSPFTVAPPQAKTNRGYSLRRLSQEIVNLCERVTVMRTQEGLTGTDLLAAFITRRVLPLQRCSCLIGEMIGLQDPNRMGLTWLSAEQAGRAVNAISRANLGEDWRFGSRIARRTWHHR